MQRGRLSLFLVLVSLPFGLLAACTSFSGELDEQLLRPPNGWLVEPADLGLSSEPFEVILHSEASLTGWWIPHEAALGRTVVLVHEEATNVSAIHPYYTFLHNAGFNVLAFDPRGFGHSVGTPTLRAWLYDLNSVFEWLHERGDVDRNKIALFGTSLGSVAAMWSARRNRDCCAIVFEHLPSLRQMLRDSIADDGTAMGAYALGMMEFAGLPRDIEPLDNAPLVRARAMFIATENEPKATRQALLQTYAAYAGEKELWVVPGAGRAPHAMLTHDIEYQSAITSFLTRAFADTPVPIGATAHKVSDASDGEAWYEIRLATQRATTSEPWAVEACAILEDGSPRFARTWVDGAIGRVRIKLPSAPVQVSAIRVLEAVTDDEGVFVPRSTHRSRSGVAVAHLWPRIEELRNDQLSKSGCRDLAAQLRRAGESEAFHPALEAELADVFAKIGLRLAGSPASPAAIAWLERAVAAVPKHPKRHFWPGPVPTYGFPREHAVNQAKRRLQSLKK